MDQKTIADIVAMVLKGDRQAYALLIEAYKGPVFNLAFRMTGSREDADDLTQETFIRAYQKLYRFDQGKKFHTWLYTIGLNLIRNHLKKKARDTSHRMTDRYFPESRIQAEGEREDGLIAEESMKSLEESMQQLPVALREALILKFQQDLTFEELASITGDSVSAVKMRVYRGLEQLKRLMKSGK